MPTLQTTSPRTERLRQHLAKEYCDTLRHPVESDFLIDDRTDSDAMDIFCTITLYLNADGTLELVLNNIPVDDGVQIVIDELDGKVDDLAWGARATIPLTDRSTTPIRNLGKAIRAAVGRRRQYLNSNWKWICRRTDASLNRLATCLREFRSAEQ